jgi:hypothetical protein
VNLLHAIYRAYRVAIGWDKTVQLAAKGRYESALAELEKVQKNWGTNSLPPKHLLLRAHIECHLKRPDLAMVDITNAYSALVAKRWYPENENNYLTHYAAKFGFKLSEAKGYGGKELFASSLPHFNRDKVSSYNQKIFPLDAL